MLINFATLAMLALYLSIGVCGVLLLRRHGIWRVAGVILIFQALLLIVAQVLASTYPIGFEPYIRLPFWEVLLQAGITLLALGGAALLAYAVARWLDRKLAYSRRRGLVLAPVLLLIPSLALAGMFGLGQA